MTARDTAPLQTFKTRFLSSVHLGGRLSSRETGRTWARGRGAQQSTLRLPSTLPTVLLPSPFAMLLLLLAAGVAATAMAVAKSQLASHQWTYCCRAG